VNDAQTAVETARRLVGTGVYHLGTGDCDTPVGGNSDCFGFAFCRCYNVRRHRPGFNRGAWSTVEDDLNCNSAIEDAEHKQELFQLVKNISDVQPGDLLAYPTFWVRGVAPKMSMSSPLHQFIGHIAIVQYQKAQNAVPAHFSDLMVAQCCGPNGRKPGILSTDGSHWDQHDHTWPKPEHRTRILRVKQ
jgi:hypothetical protein